MVICGITTSVRLYESILKSLLEKWKSSTVACTGVAGASAEVAAATPTEPLCACNAIATPDVTASAATMLLAAIVRLLMF
jgi:hypothetical protein